MIGGEGVRPSLKGLWISSTCIGSWESVQVMLVASWKKVEIQTEREVMWSDTIWYLYIKYSYNQYINIYFAFLDRINSTYQ